MPRLSAVGISGLQAGEDVKEHARMKAGWEHNENISRAKGDAWLEACSKPLMRVPSAIVPATSNVLVNPRHPDAKRIKLKADEAFRFDPRLLA